MCTAQPIAMDVLGIAQTDVSTAVSDSDKANSIDRLCKIIFNCLSALRECRKMDQFDFRSVYRIAKTLTSMTDMTKNSNFQFPKIKVGKSGISVVRTNPCCFLAEA